MTSHLRRTPRERNGGLRKPDVIYYPTPPETVEEMLRMAKIKKVMCSTTSAAVMVASRLRRPNSLAFALWELKSIRSW